jgi:hypothetical protein
MEVKRSPFLRAGTPDLDQPEGVDKLCQLLESRCFAVNGNCESRHAASVRPHQFCFAQALHFSDKFTVRMWVLQLDNGLLDNSALDGFNLSA